MNVSSVIQSKGSTVPQPRHQAIGRNGSFWIPEDSSELSKHPKPVAQKSSKTNFESPKQTSNTQGNLKANAVSDKLKQNENFEVKVYNQEQLHSDKYKIIGEISVEGCSCEIEKMLKEIKDKVKHEGGDALIDLNLGDGVGGRISTDTYLISGKVISL